VNWEQLLSSERIGGPSITPSIDVRSPFECDVDRVIFSGAFRRLAGKTQVHPFSGNDHIHNRLTHSLEVARVGRSLGKSVGKRLGDKLPKGISAFDLGAIVQAACMAHDLGNPPFGHAGESAMEQWFQSLGSRYLEHLSPDYRRDVTLFDGNAQGFRMITQTENYLWDGGLRLTYPTLGAFLKYPWTSREAGSDHKFGAFLTEEPILDKVAIKLGLVRDQKQNRWCRHPLAFLAEAADDICYSVIDLEDAVALGVYSYKKARRILLNGLNKKTRKTLEPWVKDEDAYRIGFTRMRGPVFACLVSAVVEAFFKNYDAIMAGNAEKGLIASLPPDDPCRLLVERAKEAGKKEIYPTPHKAEIELGCFSTFDCLMDAHCGAGVEYAEHLNSKRGETFITWRASLVLKLLGRHAPNRQNAPPGSQWCKYQCLRRMVDYVSGMTDDYAVYVSEKLRGRTTGRA